MIWRIFDIRWDCDGESPNDNGLPENILLVEDGGQNEGFWDRVEDFLSDYYGFCHNGYSSEPFNPELQLVPLDKVTIHFTSKIK